MPEFLRELAATDRRELAEAVVFRWRELGSVERLRQDAGRDLDGIDPAPADVRTKLLELPRLQALAARTGARLIETVDPEIVEQLHAWVQRACSVLA